MKYFKFLLISCLIVNICCSDGFKSKEQYEKEQIKKQEEAQRKLDKELKEYEKNRNKNSDWSFLPSDDRWV